MGARSPAISVVIPTFNRAAMLADTLESFAAQSIPTNRYEVIVVDDGSKDATPEVCRDFGSRMQLRYLHIENSGISAAKNRERRPNMSLNFGWRMVLLPFAIREA